MLIENQELTNLSLEPESVSLDGVNPVRFRKSHWQHIPGQSYLVVAGYLGTEYLLDQLKAEYQEHGVAPQVAQATEHIVRVANKNITKLFTDGGIVTVQGNLYPLSPEMKAFVDEYGIARRRVKDIFCALNPDVVVLKDMETVCLGGQEFPIKSSVGIIAPDAKRLLNLNLTLGGALQIGHPKTNIPYAVPIIQKWLETRVSRLFKRHYQASPDLYLAIKPAAIVTQTLGDLHSKSFSQPGK